MNALTSIKTQVPIDYYRLPFCRPEVPKRLSNNLGQTLRGDRIQRSPYEVQFLQETHCHVVCARNISEEQGKQLEYYTRNSYHQNLILDNLPSAAVGRGRNGQEKIRYAGGFPMGFIASDTKLPYIYNHMNINIQYHRQSGGRYRVVQFGVEPLSIRHQFRDDDPNELLTTCKANTHISRSDILNSQVVRAGENIVFTYDVSWRESEVTKRWDVYLTEDHLVSDTVHWFSVTNSVLTVLVTLVVIGCVWRRNISHYKRVRNDEDEQTNSNEGETSYVGWKAIRQDVFRPPAFPTVLSSMCGTGAHLLTAAVLAVVFLFFGAKLTVNPDRRGWQLMQVMFAYVLTGYVNGFVCVRFYKTFGGSENWNRVVAMSMLSYPAMVFVVFVALQNVHKSQRSTSVVKLSCYFQLMLLWLATTGCAFVGGYFANKRPPIRLPVRPNETPRPIPRSSRPRIVGFAVYCLLGAVAPFASMYVEFFFLMTAMWMEQAYSTFGFLFLVVLTAAITTAAVTVVLHFFLILKSEDHRWWWKSFVAGGGFTAAYCLLYACVLSRALELTRWTGWVLYFGYMTLACGTLFLLFGFVGLSACLWFNRQLYSVFDDEEEIDTAPDKSEIELSSATPK